MTRDHLNQLMRFAAAGGAAPDWLDGIAAALVADAIELIELRRCADPRRRRTLTRAARLAKAERQMRESGTSDRVASLCERFGVRRSRYYQLLKMSSESLDSSQVESGSWKI